MDQIHEELKQAIFNPDEDLHSADPSSEGQEGHPEEQCSSDEDQETAMPSPHPSPIHKSKLTFYKMMKDIDTKVEPSDGEYETCDSGLSSNRNSTEPSLSSSDEALPENNDVTPHPAAESMETDGIISHPGSTQNLNDIGLSDPELGRVQDKHVVDDDTVSGSETIDSGIGSTSSSTLVSSNSIMSGCVGDVPSVLMRSPTKLKDTKELANKQEQQHRQETEISQSVGGFGDAELTASVEMEPPQVQRFVGLGKRSRTQSERRPRSRSSSDLSQGHSPVGRGKSGEWCCPVKALMLSKVNPSTLFSDRFTDCFPTVNRRHTELFRMQ